MKLALVYPLMVVLACRLAVGQSQFKVLYSFGNGPNDGRQPNAGLVYHSGQVYGTTPVGGAYCTANNGDGCGTIFALGPFYEVIYSFCTTGDPNNCPDGSLPSAGLVADSAGNLYGTAEWGGTGTCAGQAGGCGAVFELSRISRFVWTETVLHSFTGPDGENPTGGVTFDADGNLYGTTYNGGGYGAGAVFELIPNRDGTWAETTLHDFNPSVGDGANPFATVINDGAENLYGTTSLGGGTGCQGQGCGTAFQLSPNMDGTWTETIIHKFGPEQGYPLSSLTLGEHGTLYGTTSGPNDGGVFRLMNSGGVWNLVAFSFNGQDGSRPQAALLLKGDALYGTTYVGGANDWGTIFEMEGRQETVLHSFSGYPNDGTIPPAGGPLLSGEGSLFGVTGQGGEFNLGTIFQLTP
jgi:uncharacterized repeat protein (TIGR03803 family)